MTPVRLELVALRSLVKHSTNEQLLSLINNVSRSCSERVKPLTYKTSFFTDNDAGSTSVRLPIPDEVILGGYMSILAKGMFNMVNISF